MKLLAGRKSAVYLGVNEHFADKADAERALLDDYLADLASGNFFYFIRTRPRKSVVICETFTKFAVTYQRNSE